MSIQFRTQGRSIIVFGNTFPHKDRIKALGGRFNGNEKTWRLPLNDENLASIGELAGQTLPGQKIGGTLFADEVVPSERPQPVAGGAVELNPEDGLSIRELMDRVQQAVTRAFGGPVWVVGEVQNLARRASGCFFELAEPTDGGHQASTTTVRALLWQSTEAVIGKLRGADVVKDVLQDGMRIRCLCQVSVYRERGNVSLHVEDVDPSYSKGALALAREKLLRELRAKGLDRANKTRPLVPFPFHLGLITAEGSRAHSDFLDQLEGGGFPGKVHMVATPMQGEAVPVRVVQALDRLQGEGVDAIVLTRGGGSAADLRWFDAPEIAYAIANCTVPVICAIGHHDDVCVAEEIAHRREKTPTAAAEFVLGVFAATRERIDGAAAQLALLLGRRIEEFSQLTGGLSERLGGAIDRSLMGRRDRLAHFSHGLAAQSQARLLGLRGRVDGLKGRIDLAGTEAVARREMLLTRLEGDLRSKDPTPWLARGWTQLATAAGALLSVTQVKPGDVLKTRLVDGRLQLQVTAIDPLAKKEGGRDDGDS